MKLPWQKEGNGKEPARVATGEGVILKRSVPLATVG